MGGVFLDFDPEFKTFEMSKFHIFCGGGEFLSLTVTLSSKLVT